MRSPVEHAPLPPSSLVICTRNRPRLVWQAVESVLSGTELPTELIVVDQSEVPHAQLASLADRGDCQVRYVWMHTVGASRARNHGASIAQHAIVAFIDDDMLVAPEWYARLIRALVQAGPGSVVTGRVLPGPVEVPRGFVPALVEGTESRSHAGRIGTDVLPGCHFALDRLAFLGVGGLDEQLGPGARFPAAEDNDLGFRLLEAGLRIVYAPECVIYHRAWRSTSAFWPLRWAYGRGQGAFYAKHLSLRDTHMARRLAWDIGLRTIRFPWRFIHRPRLALADLVFTVGLVTGCAEWLARHALQPASPTARGVRS